MKINLLPVIKYIGWILIFIMLILGYTQSCKGQELDIITINFDGKIYPVKDTSCIKILVIKNKCLDINRRKKFIIINNNDTIIYMNGKYYYNFEPNWIILK